MYLELYLVRHGESTGNVKRIVQELDCPLTWRGRRQSRKAGRKLKNLKFKKAYSSDLDRAIQTTGLIIRKLKYNPAVVEESVELRERNFTSMRGLTYEQAGIANIPSEELYPLDRGEIEIYKDVESLEEVRKRTSGIKNRVLRLNYERSLIVAHEWILSYLMNDLLEEEISKKTFHPQNNCAISYFKLNHENGKVLEYKIAQDKI